MKTLLRRYSVMFSFTATSILALAALTTLTTASPTLRHAARQEYSGCSAGDSVEITLIGAADAQYSISVPCNNMFTPTNNVLSISHVQSNSGPCAFIGVDGGFLVVDSGYADYGPPQTVVGVICGPPPTN